MPCPAQIRRQKRDGKRLRNNDLNLGVPAAKARGDLNLAH
jgi:hypothetical protein